MSEDGNIVWEHDEQDSRTPAHLNDRDVTEVLQTVRRILTVLDMPHYRVFIGPRPAEDGTYATVYTVETKNSATLELCPEWSQLTPERRLTSLIHECLHMALARQDWQVLNDLGGLDTLIGGERIDVIKANYRLTSEVFVDQMTYVLRRLLDREWPPVTP